MNAKDQQKAIEAFRTAEASSTLIALGGVWRIWFLHGGGSHYVQGDPMSRAESSNPNHVFEIHPVTSVGTMTVLNSLRPIDGFQPKDAQEAFSRFESLPCKIVSNTV